MNWSLAIDLGTSNTVAAARTPDGDLLVPLGAHGPAMPSAVFRGADSDYAGELALEHAGDPDGTLHPAPKRLVGELPPEEAAEVLALVLAEALARARAAHGPEGPARLALTHPEAWSARSRGVLAEAAQRTGVPAADIVLVPEPRAAAAHYAHPGPGAQDLLIVDVGGGTTDTAVVRVGADSGRVLAAHGDSTLGGRALDARLARLVLGRLDAADPALRRRLGADPGFRESARRARERLSAEPDARVRLPESATAADAGLPAEVLVTAAEYEEAVAADIDRVVALARHSLEAARVPAATVRLHLTGGVSATPALVRALSDLAPVAEVADPLTAVCLGALNWLDEPGAAAEPPAGEPAPATAVARRRARRRGRIAAAAAAVLALGAAGLWALDRGAGPGGPAGDRPAAVDRPDFLGPVRPLTPPADSPVFDSAGDLDCRGLVVAAGAELAELGYPGPDQGDIGGFGGNTRCSLDLDAGRVELRTYTPRALGAWHGTLPDTRLPAPAESATDPGPARWHHLPGDPANPASAPEYLAYVSGHGWVVVSPAYVGSGTADPAVWAATAQVALAVDAHLG